MLRYCSTVVQGMAQGVTLHIIHSRMCRMYEEATVALSRLWNIGLPRHKEERRKKRRGGTSSMHINI